MQRAQIYNEVRAIVAQVDKGLIQVKVFFLSTLQSVGLFDLSLDIDWVKCDDVAELLEKDLRAGWHYNFHQRQVHDDL